MNPRGTPNAATELAARAFAEEPAHRTRRRQLLTGAELFLCTTAVVIASAAFLPFFGEPSFLVPVAGSAILGAGCGALIAAFRRLSALLVVASAVAFVAYAIYLVFPDLGASGLPGPSAVLTVGEGLLRGLARMLTISPPTDLEPELLILPVGLAFAAAFASALLIGKAPALLPVLPPLLVFVVAVLISASVPGFQWQVTLGFVGCALGILLLRANRATTTAGATTERTKSVDAAAFEPTQADDDAGSRWHSTAGRVLIGLPLILVVAMLAIAGGGFLPIANGDTRFDLREYRQTPIDLQAQLNPLVDVRRQLEQASTAAVFTIRTGDGGPLPVDRIRVAALDTYDGVQWLTTAKFSRTGSTLPPGPDLAEPARYTVKVTLTGDMTPPLLPEIGQPVRVEAHDIGFDQFSGLLVSTDRSLAGYSYSLTADLPAQQINAATAVPATGPEFDPLLQLPVGVDGDPGAGLAALARQLSSNAAEPISKLQLIADQLKSWPYALDAAPGHSYAALDRFLPNAPDTVDKRVTEEQTVAAFVIMARSLGYPARVAVGYRIDPAAPAADGTYTVTKQDADAWAEVAFAGQGWVPFSTTAPRDGAPPAPPQQQQQPDADGKPDVVNPSTTGPDAPIDGAAGTAIWLIIALCLLAVLLVAALLVGIVVFAKWNRRRRRSSTGSPADRIVGAWQESTARLRDNGLPISTVLTPREVQLHTTTQFGEEAGTSVATLCPLVTEAVYAPVEPSEDAVIRAWDLEGELRSILDARRSAGRRLLSLIDPRQLWSAGAGGSTGGGSGTTAGAPRARRSWLPRRPK